MSHSTTATQQADLQERLAEVAGRAKNFTGAGGVAIALASGDHFTTFVTLGTSLEVGAVVPIPTSFGGFRKEKGNVLRCPDTDKEATIDIKACRAARIKSMLVVPVGELSSIRGVLAVFAIGAHAFTETHVAVLKTLAEVISHLLPEKQKMGGLTAEKPEKKADELLEHPFNPAFDSTPRTVKVGSADQPELNPVPSPPPVPPSSHRPSTTGSIFAGGATPPPSVSKPAPGNGLTSATPLNVPAPTPSRTTTTTSFQSPTQGNVLDLASDPIAEGALVTPKRASKRTTPRSSVTTSTTSFSPISVTQQRSFDFKKFYAALIAVAVVVAVGWGVYGILAARNQKRVEQSYIIPPPATPRVNPSASPASNRRIEPEPVQPAPAHAADPELIQPAAAKVEPIHAAPVTSLPMKTDVIGSASAGILPERASTPPPTPQRIVVQHKSGDPEVLKGQDILVVSQPSPAALRKLEEESPPEVNVPTNSGMIGNLLNGSAPAPTPVLKQSQVVAAVLVSKVAPIYPDQAKRYGLSGKVTINAKVTKTGIVGEVRSVSGNSILSEAAISAVKKWRYKPATMDGRPVDSNVELTFDFNPPR